MATNDDDFDFGYRVFFPDDEHVYDRDRAEHNHRLLIEHQTLIGADDPA
jgi:hypothetical protein